MRKLLARATTAIQARRDAWAWFDHLVRAGQRYKADHGDRLAASLTMYLILALLPLLLLAASVLGYVLANDPERQAEVFAEITGVIPGIGAQLSDAMSTIEESRGTLGAVGLAGLLFSGFGGIDALRDGLRLIWHHDVDAEGFLRKKATDVVTLGVLAVTLALSFGVSALATFGAGVLLDTAGVGGPVARAILSGLSFAVGIGVDAALFLVLFKWLPRVDWPWRRLVRGAVFGGVAFGALKIAGAWYVGRTAVRSSALYGSIGTAVAVLVGLYLVSRVILFTAAWTVTAPGWDDVEPSGTASVEAARAAGIPVEAVTDPATRADPHRLDPVGTPAAADRVARVTRLARPARPARPARGSGAARPAAPGVLTLVTRAAQGFAATAVALLSLRGLRTLRRG